MLPFLGTAFIPEMKEGSVVPAMDRVPNISLDESLKMEREAMRLVMEVPGVKSAVSGGPRRVAGRSAVAERVDPHRVAQAARRVAEGWTQEDIQDAMREKLKALPGVNIVMAQPISDRVDEMVTGVRADVAVKIFGYDLDVLRDKAAEIARVARTVPGASEIKIERVTGQQYLTIEIDRPTIARHGINVADVND
jgi:cobalt-zinc-cadmium resistance protein CzcA